MTIGSLFSGIGGLELGLEWAGLGPTVWQVEIEKDCRDILALHWKDTERYEDVCKVGAQNLQRVDVICGGFPCTDLSSAGSRAGLAGERSGLWREFARIVGEMRPQWAVVENVTSGAANWVDVVCGDLEFAGYAPLPVPMQADWLGAPYPRARVFIVARKLADVDRDREPVLSFDDEMARAPASCRVDARQRKAAGADSKRIRKQSRRGSWPKGEGPAFAPIHRWSEPMPEVAGVVSGSARRMAGNCVVPQCAEIIGWIIREIEAGVQL